MNEKKQLLSIALLCLTIGGAVLWILRQQRDAARPETRPHVGVGEVLAEEAAKQLAKREKKRVVAITLQSHDPILKTQEEAFLARLKKVCPEAEMKEFYRVDPEGEKHYGPGLGLNARRFTRIIEKNIKADVLVSFIGTPDPSAPELHHYTNKIPRFVAASRDLADVRKLLEKNWLRAAIVPRYSFPAPSAEPKSARDWFDRQFQVVTTNELAALPN